MTNTPLSIRLDFLGWSMADLARAYCIQEGLEPNRANMKLKFVMISRAVKNPEKINFGIYKKILKAAGGEFIYEWSNIK